MLMKFIDQLEKKYNNMSRPFAVFLTSLEEKYLHIDTSAQETSAKAAIPDDAITPDKEYVKMLIGSLSALEGNLGQTEYKHFEKGLQDLLKNGDFDDGEEIMEEVHSLIEKYIYGSDTKVSGKQWPVLEKYLETAGYTPVSVKNGDDVTPYRTYFNRPIQAEGGVPNTIKHITLMPYIIKFYDGEEIQELKLCGKCTYYK